MVSETLHGRISWLSARLASGSADSLVWPSSCIAPMLGGLYSLEETREVQLHRECRGAPTEPSRPCCIGQRPLRMLEKQ